MKITPIDIQQQQFKGKLFGGLDPDDVDSFLQQVAQELEDLARENSDLREQGRRAATSLEEFADQEKALRETMLAAQRVTEEIRINAEKEAALKVSEAELRAERTLADAELKLAQLKDEIQELRRQKLQFEMGLKSLLDTHYRMLSLSDE